MQLDSQKPTQTTPQITAPNASGLSPGFVTLPDYLRPSDFGLRTSPRPVTLWDGRLGLRGALGVQAQVPVATATGDTPSLPIIDFIASNEALDRYGEIIIASGWRLENYLRNPVFQNAHQYGDILFTLGKALITEVRSGPPPTEPRATDPNSPAAQKAQATSYLFQRVQFATDINPVAKIAYGLYRDKFLNAVSVGFIPLRWEDGGPETGYRRRYIEQELLEVSAVGLPANPQALQLALKAGALHKSDLKDALDCLRQSNTQPAQSPSHFRSDHAAPDTHASASGIRGNEAQLLQLARDLSRALREYNKPISLRAAGH